jgi:hypothetical protein
MADLLGLLSRNDGGCATRGGSVFVDFPRRTSDSASSHRDTSTNETTYQNTTRKTLLLRNTCFLMQRSRRLPYLTRIRRLILLRGCRRRRRRDRDGRWLCLLPGYITVPGLRWLIVHVHKATVTPSCMIEVRIPLKDFYKNDFICVFVLYYNQQKLRIRQDIFMV